MLLIEQAKEEVELQKAQLAQIADALKLTELKKKKIELEEKQAKDDFWGDMVAAQEVNTSLARVNEKINRHKKLVSRVEDIELMIMLCEECGALDDTAEISADIAKLDIDIDKFKLETLLKGKYDANNAILTLHAGAGGTEAQDWTQMLFRMYSRYGERMGYKVEVIDELVGEEAGIKSISFFLRGTNAYGYLKAEKGVHRLVRISPFDSGARRHTSFASLEVMPEIENPAEIVIDSEDLRIDTYRSGGKGGQHVNKTDSAVRITHLPTNIVVQCQNERSQLQNKEQAMRMLMSKLIDKQEQDLIEQGLEIKGDIKKIEWGSQIRSYVFCPYTMVKDHRTGCETGNIIAVMDGDIEQFILDYLKKSN